MNWTINLAIAILLSSLTGACLFLVWYTIGKILEEMGRINVMYLLLKVVLFFWYFPITYLIFYNLNYDRWGGFLFRTTDTLDAVCKRCCIGWTVASGTLILKYLFDAWLLRRRYRKSVPVDDEIYDCFVRVCEELGIRAGKVDLVYDYKTKSPCIGGLVHNYVVLPTLEYSREQLRVIFLHELTHYKQKNHVLRHLTQIALAFHFFNPLMWVMKWKVCYWGEYACDYDVIPKTQGADYYFDIIQGISSSPTFVQSLDSRLFENDREIQMRKALAKRSYRMKTKSRILAFAVICIMTLSSTVSVQAATMGAGEMYYNTYFTTIGDQSEMVSGTDGIEYTAPGFERGVIVTKERESLFSKYAFSNYEWVIRANRAQSSRNFTASAGQKIYMSSLASPSSARYKMGIITPDNTLRYVTVTGYGAHAFTLTSSGTYAIFIQNLTDGQIIVNGNYNVE